MRVKNIKKDILLKRKNITISRFQLCLPQIIISDGDNYVIELGERDILVIYSMFKNYKKENKK